MVLISSNFYLYKQKQEEMVMSKMWYPVIDYLLCQECGACTAKCKNGVYDQSKAPTPVVINPDNCIDHCRGCGKLCPNGAITYVGDNITQTESGCGCGGGSCCG